MNLPPAAALVTLIATATTSVAQWTATILRPGSGFTQSQCLGIAGPEQVGSRSFNNPPQACKWEGSTASWIDLHPGNAFESIALGTSGSTQVGRVRFNPQNSQFFQRAALWHGTAASLVDLHPSSVEFSYSIAYGAAGQQQVGTVNIPNEGTYASLWSGSAASWVNLNPGPSYGSNGYAIADGQQVGSVIVAGRPHASLWHGSAASWVDLHPSIAVASEALGVSAGQQVGSASITTNGISTVVASLWSGTAASWVNLNPPGATSSIAYGVFRGQQVGSAVFEATPNIANAILWNGSAGTWIDLNVFVPLPSLGSEARGIWRDEQFTYVAGKCADPANPNKSVGVLWTRANPCGADLDDGSGTGTPNGAVDINDLLFFLSAFESGFFAADLDNGTSTGTPDNAVDINDLLFFLARFEAGC